MGAGPMSELRIIIAAAVILAAVLGVNWWRKSLIAEGDAIGAARVQAAWDKAEASRNTATAQDNATRFRNAERTTIDSEVFILKYSVMPSHGDDGNHRHEKAFA